MHRAPPRQRMARRLIWLACEAAPLLLWLPKARGSHAYQASHARLAIPHQLLWLFWTGKESSCYASAHPETKGLWNARPREGAAGGSAADPYLALPRGWHHALSFTWGNTPATERKHRKESETRSACCPDKGGGTRGCLHVPDPEGHIRSNSLLDGAVFQVQYKNTSDRATNNDKNKKHNSHVWHLASTQLPLCFKISFNVSCRGISSSCAMPLHTVHALYHPAAPRSLCRSLTN